MNEKRRCYMKSEQETRFCDRKCQYYEGNLACPFRTPREFWDTNLCDACANKSVNCRFLENAVRNRRSGFVVGCFGFKQKEEEK